MIRIKKFLTFGKQCKFNEFEYHFQLFYGKNNSLFDSINCHRFIITQSKLINQHSTYTSIRKADSHVQNPTKRNF
jgi:hypothetical protein